MSPSPTHSLLERLEARFDRLEDKVDDLSTSMAALKVKSGVWGALAGMLPVLLALAYLIFERTP